MWLDYLKVSQLESAFECRILTRASLAQDSHILAVNFDYPILIATVAVP
jgi:hypothetical protein